MSYWGNKLGPVVQPPAQPQPRYSPDVVPRGMGNTDQSIQRAVNHYVSQLPGQQMNPGVVPQQFGVQPPPQNWTPKSAAENPTNVSDVLPIWQWQGNPNGGAGETAKIGSCPHCGSGNYFSRATAGSGVLNTSSGMLVPPAPECFECGYPRLQGGLSGEYTGAQVMQGPAAATRQGAAPAPAPGTIGTLTR